MIAASVVEAARRRAAQLLADAGIVLTDAERAAVEVADFGLNELEQTGLELVTYINTAIYCAKELVLFPHQTCPEHRHPPVAGGPGKMETFRVRKGRVFLYVPGKPTRPMKGRIPSGGEGCYTVFKEIVLNAGEQYTLQPNTLHWFQADQDGAIVSEFSSVSRDGSDIFTDPRIQRETRIDPSR